MRTPRSIAPIIAAASLLTLVGCASDDPAPDGGSSDSDAVAITDTGDACQVSDTDLAAGKTTFEIKNDGDQITEVYVYAEGDKVVTEKENIGPGTSATMNVDLAEGMYEIACKPGMTGDGNRTSVHVSGEGGEAMQTTYDREVEIQGVDYAFEGMDDFTAEAGEAIEFKMENTGTVQHEFEVFGPDGVVLGEIGPTDVGKTGEVILLLEEPGTYEYICDIEDHKAKGMQGTFEVS